MIGSYEEVRLIRRGPMSTRGSYEEVPSSFPPCPVEAAGAAGVLTTPMASADHRLAALVAAFAFAQVRPATLAVVRPGRAALGAAATAATLSAAVAAAALVLPASVERLVLRH